MKRNMLAVLILVVSLANLVMTGLMIFVVLPGSKSYTELVNKVATAIELEEKESNADEISVDEKEQYVYDKADFTINLKKEGKKDSYVVINQVSLTLNTSDKDYEKTKKLLDANEVKVHDMITTIYEAHTKTEVTTQKKEIKEEVLQKLKEEFESDAIIDISYGSITCQ